MKKVNSQKCQKGNTITFAFLAIQKNTSKHLLNSSFSPLLNKEELKCFVNSSWNTLLELHINDIKLSEQSRLVFLQSHCPTLYCSSAAVFTQSHSPGQTHCKSSPYCIPCLQTDPSSVFANLFSASSVCSVWSRGLGPGNSRATGSTAISDMS